MIVRFPKRRRTRRRSSDSAPTRENVRPAGLALHVRFVSALQAHRLRAVGLGFLGLVLVVFVATTSLPLAISGSHPEVALLLSPGNSRALMTLAHQERRALFLETQADALPAAGDEANGEASGEADDAVANAALSAEMNGDAAPSVFRDGADVEAVPEVVIPVAPETGRQRIREVAAQALETAPLSADAYRLLGEMEPDLAKARQDMIEAVARSRRETVATFWLMNQNYERSDAAGVVRMADILLRTRTALNQYTLSYLNSLVTTPQGRTALAQALRQQPPWRLIFMRGLGTQLAASDDPLALFQLMKEGGDIPSDQELIPFLDARMRAERSATGAYNIWLQLLPMERLTQLRPVNNLDFAQEFSGLPFDWRVPRSNNVFIDFQPSDSGRSGRMLRVRFGSGRFTFSGVSQIVFLRPGAYRFEGMQRGRMFARRGMRWQITCFNGNRLLAQSDQLMGAPRDWRLFSFDFTIPEDANCDAQILRLVHDGRTPSEQMATGEIVFDHLSIVTK